MGSVRVVSGLVGALALAGLVPAGEIGAEHATVVDTVLDPDGEPVEGAAYLAFYPGSDGGTATISGIVPATGEIVLPVERYLVFIRWDSLPPAVGQSFSFLTGVNTTHQFDGPGVEPTIVGTGESETINGTSGDDVIFAGAGDDDINGRGGNDTIWGGTGNDTINGGAGYDVVVDYNGANVVTTSEDVTTGDGNDTITGGSGPDSMTSGSGDDLVRSQGGDDLVYLGSGSDEGYGGGGNDTVSNEGTVRGGADLLYGNAGDDSIRVAPGEVVTAFGGRGNDTLTQTPFELLGQLLTFDCGPGADNALTVGPAPPPVLISCEVVGEPPA